MRHFRTTALAALICAVATIGAATTYTVTSTADSGAGTLRQAILDANANPGADTIAFNITGPASTRSRPTSGAARHHRRRDDRRLHAGGRPPRTRTPWARG